MVTMIGTTTSKPRGARVVRRRRDVLWWVSRWALPLYRLHLMWLLGRRFLIVSHVGRVTGELHRTCLMVLRDDRDTGEIVVVAGSRTADWYRNVLAAPPVEVAIGNDRFKPSVRPLTRGDLRRYLAEARRDHPWTARVQAAFFHWPWPATPRQLDEMANRLGGIALTPLTRCYRRGGSEVRPSSAPSG